MNINAIDKNFDTNFAAPDDVKWFSIRETPFSIYGVTYSEEEGFYRRMPREIADAVNFGVSGLSAHTAGGRVRFVTDSPYIAVRVKEPFEKPFCHMSFVAKKGVSLFANGMFVGTIRPIYDQIVAGDNNLGGNGEIVFDGIKYPYGMQGKAYEVEIYFPLYTPVNEIYVGLKKDCILQKTKGYKHKTPIVFYGSSITQGACASKPGDDYVNRISRMLDTDIMNLGFSGSAKAEKIMAEYLASLNPSVFVLDYDENAPDAEYLGKTHFALYETIRKEHPTTPIIMMTLPAIEGYDNRSENKARKEVILNSLQRAKSLGDKNVYMIDCYGCFGESINGECGTVDEIHPDSLGFLRMAERLKGVLSKILNSEMNSGVDIHTKR